MTPIERIREFLGLKRFALVGVSRQASDLSRMLLREFLARGYQAVPVNPDVDNVEGEPCFARLQEIQPPVTAALFMTSPAVTDTLVKDCAAAGITKVWMFRGPGGGSATPDAILYCEANGISVIPGECPYMFLPGTQLIHRMHGFVRKMTGSYPR